MVPRQQNCFLVVHLEKGNEKFLLDQIYELRARDFCEVVEFLSANRRGEYDQRKDGEEGRH
jgi:hypothetical protein